MHDVASVSLRLCRCGVIGVARDLRTSGPGGSYGNCHYSLVRCPESESGACVCSFFVVVKNAELHRKVFHCVVAPCVFGRDLRSVCRSCTGRSRSPHSRVLWCLCLGRRRYLELSSGIVGSCSVDALELLVFVFDFPLKKVFA